MMQAIKGTPGQGLFGATLGFFIGFAAVSLFGPTAVHIKEIMQLSPVQVGMLVAMPSLSGSLLRIPFSAWVDTTGGRKPFLTLLTLSIIGMLGLTLILFYFYPAHLTANFYPILLFLGLLCGCGIATFSVGISQVSYWFPQRKQGRALGTYAGIGNTAPGIFSFLMPFAFKGWGLGGTYLAWLIFLLVGTGLYYALGKNAWFFQLRSQGVAIEKAKTTASQHGQEIFPSNGLFESMKRSASIWKTWSLVIVYFTTFGGFIALTAWLPTYWRSLFGVSLVTAGTLTALYSILTSLIRVAGGFMSDYIGGERTGLLALSVMIIGAIIMFLAQELWLAVVAEILMGLGMGVGNAAVFKLVPQEIPQAVGGAAGWVGGIGALGGFVIPPILGLFVFLTGIIGYRQGFCVFVVLGIVSMISLRLLHNHNKRTRR